MFQAYISNMITADVKVDECNIFLFKIETHFFNNLVLHVCLLKVNFLECFVRNKGIPELSIGYPFDFVLSEH